jgi:hypothetical protein
MPGAQRRSWTVNCVARNYGPRSVERIFLFVRGYHPVHHARRDALDVGATHPHGTDCQSAGRPLRQGSKGRRGGKSGLHGRTVPDNVRRGRPQGKCHRNETACPPRGGPARVKRCGKSAPRCRQRERHGKPHREQNRIGVARVLAKARPGLSGPATRVGCLTRRATGVAEEWPSRAGQPAPYRTRLTGRLMCRGASGGAPAGRPTSFL